MNKALALVCIGFIVISLMLTGQSFAKMDPSTCIGMWLFDEGAGKVAEDFSGNGNDGEIMNGPNWVDGKFGKALEFEGKGAVEIPDSDSLNDVDDITIMAWVYLNRAVTSGTWNALVGKRPYTSGYLMWIEVPQEPCGLVYVSGRFDNRAARQIDLNKWYHLVFTRVHDGDMKFFINGELVKEANSSSGVISTLAAPISIAGQSPQVLDGIVDDVAIFNVALTEDSISSIMKNGLKTIYAVSSVGKLSGVWGAIKAQ